MRIEVGMRLETNYATGPYTVEHVRRGCTSCHAPLDFLEDGPFLPPHLHLWLRNDEGQGGYSLNFYDETTLRSIVPPRKDRIILLEAPAPYQASLL